MCAALLPSPDVDREAPSLRRCRPPDSDDTAAAELLAAVLAGALCLPVPLSAGELLTVEAFPSAPWRVVGVPAALPVADLPDAAVPPAGSSLGLLVAVASSVPVDVAGTGVFGGCTLTAGSFDFVAAAPWSGLAVAVLDSPAAPGAAVAAVFDGASPAVIAFAFVEAVAAKVVPGADRTAVIFVVSGIAVAASALAAEAPALTRLPTPLMAAATAFAVRFMAVMTVPARSWGRWEMKLGVPSIVSRPDATYAAPLMNAPATLAAAIVAAAVA